MKKNIVLKTILMLVLITLIFSLAACNKGKKDPDPVPDDGPTATDQLVGIIKGADGLVKTLNGVELNGNLNADIVIEANQKIGSKENKIALGVKGNVNQTNPELAVTYKFNGTEHFALGYIANKLYLKQPLTSLNAKEDGSKADNPDTLVADLTTLKPTIENAMYMLMDVLAGVELELDLDALGTDLGDMLDDWDLDLSELIVFKELKTPRAGNRLDITETLVTAAKSLFLNKLLKGTVGDVANTLVNTLFDTKDGVDYLLSGDLYVEVYKDSKATINGIKIGFTATDKSTGDILIDINKFNNSSGDKAAISFGSEYTGKSIDLMLGAYVPQKGDTMAILNALITPDFSAAGKVLASGDLKLMGDNATFETIPAFFNGTAGYFNTAGVYNAINGIGDADIIDVPANSLYSATIYKKKTDGTVDKSQSLAELLNGVLADKKAEYIADKSKPKPESGPSKGLMGTLYEWLGGALTLKDGKYVAVTEEKMLEQLNKKFGDYTRFTIYDTSPKKDEDKTKTYEKVISNITDLFDANKAWIIGTDATHEDGDYGIFDWNKAGWYGGATLYKEGEQNDLLDAVNVFLKNKSADVTLADITDFANYYIAMLSYYTTTDANFKANVDAARKTLLIAENTYQKSNKNAAAKEALETAKTAHKEAMKVAMFGENKNDYTVANNLVKQILGIESSASNVLQDVIEDGIYVAVASEKGNGLFGSLAIQNNDTAEAIEYLLIDGGISISTEVAAANITELDGAIEIVKDYVLVVGDETDFDINDYKVIDKYEDGTKKCDTEGNYVYVANKYKNRNENAEALLDALMDIYKAYLVMNG